LKFPHGKFPLKIPGPISQAKPKPIKKKFVPFRKEKKLNGGVAILQQKLTTLTRTKHTTELNTSK
jgi:hypothetical protein